MGDTVGIAVALELDRRLEQVLPPELRGNQKSTRRFEYVARKWLAGQGYDGADGREAQSEPQAESSVPNGESRCA